MPVLRSLDVEPLVPTLPDPAPAEVEPLTEPDGLLLMLPLVEPDGLLLVPPETDPLVEPDGLVTLPDVLDPAPPEMLPLVLGEALGPVVPELAVDCASLLQASKSAWVGVAANAAVHMPTTASTATIAVARVNVAMGCPS